MKKTTLEEEISSKGRKKSEWKLEEHIKGKRKRRKETKQKGVTGSSWWYRERHVGDNKNKKRERYQIIYIQERKKID